MEVKRLSDVHVAVSRESLDVQARPETIPAHPVHTFRAENGAAAKVLDALQKALEPLKAAPSAAQLERARACLRELREYEKHYLRKENILFPYLERHGFKGPSSVMWAIHDEVRAAWKTLDDLLVAAPGDEMKNGAAFDAQEDYLPQSLPPADLVLAFGEHRGVAELVVETANRVAYDDPLIAEFARYFGRPEFDITMDLDARTITAVDVVRDAVCGCARHVAQGLVSVSADEAEEKAGLLHHHHPCLAGMVKDPDFNDTLMHVSGNILKDRAGEQVRPHKHENFIVPGKPSEWRAFSNCADDCIMGMKPEGY